MWDFLTKEALELPRFHDQLVLDRVEFGYAFDDGRVAFMRERGHNVSWTRQGRNLVQAVKRVEDGRFEAASAPNLADGVRLWYERSPLTRREIGGNQKFSFA